MKSVIIIAAAVVLLFVPVNVFAVDYVDSSGYTPSWAIGNGHHTVLVKCTQVSGDSSSDSYWCLEWMAYVLDQGIENFPESTSENTSKGTSSLPNFTLEDGPLYFGHLTKFLPDETNYGNDWQVGKPFTTEGLDQMKNAGVTDFVSQRIVIPDEWDNSNFLKISYIIMEFENTNVSSQFYSKTKDAIYSQNFPTVSEFMELEDRGIFGDKYELEKSSRYFAADCIGQMINYLKENEEAKLTCLKENYIVAVMASWKTELYNVAFTMGDPEYAVNGYSKIMVNNIEYGFTKEFEKQLTKNEIMISDESSCIALGPAVIWNPTTNICVVSSFTINSGETVYVAKNVGLWISKGVFKNSGTINVLGVMDNYATFENLGTINISSQLANDGNFNNHGTILIKNDASFVNGKDGILNNYDSISNNDDLINFGTINNHCDGKITGEPIGNDFGFGDEPITQVPCETIPEKIIPETIMAPTPEVKTTTEIETPTKSDSEGGGCLIATATYGSELAPQVQQLRELRDNSLLQTESGTSFMNTFNDFYYSFSPIIADYERENPIFKEIVKIALTPLLLSLSILNYVELDSEESVLGYGISLILLNVGMYFVAPVIIIMKFRK